MRSIRNVKGVHAILIALFVVSGSFLKGGESVTDINNVVVILDGSGSMKDRMLDATRKIDAAKTALKKVLRQIPPDTHVGLLAFGAGAASDGWAFPLGPRDEKLLEGAIDKLSPQGGTPLGAFIKKGADRLLQQRAAQFGYGSYRLLIVTDGEATDGNLMERYVPEVMARGITVDVIGVAMKKQHTLARKVHSYRSADNPEALAQAVSQVFAEVGGSGDSAKLDEAFAEIAPIPSEAAAAMLRTLAASGNDPIGALPQTATPSGVSTTAPPNAAPTKARNTQATTPAPSQESGGWGWQRLLIIAIVVIVVIARRRGR